MPHYSGMRWMSTIFAGCVLLATCAYSQDAAKPGAETDAEKFVVVCPVEGMVDDGMAIVVERAVKESQGASALILNVDTPGGLVDSAIEISGTILGASCRTIAYVTGMGAISAGALIAYSCDEIIMAPATNIGASAPVIMGASEPSEEFNEKTRSYLRSRYRALGEEKGHDPLLGEAMVDAKIAILARRNAEGKFEFFRVDQEAPPSASTPEVIDILEVARKALEKDTTEAVRDLVEKIAGTPGGTATPATTATEPIVLPDGAEIVSRSGELLTLSSRQAEYYGLIPTTANTLDEVLAFNNLAGMRIVEIEPTWSERLFRWLTSPLISGLLLLFGVGGLYIEIKTPGFGLPGIIGVTCLAIFFGSYLVIGLANWIDILLVLAGLALILIEIFVTPGFGLIGVSGILCLLAGFYLALTRVTIPQYSWDFQRLEGAGQTVFVTGVLFAVFVVATWKLFPKTPFFRWIVLAQSQPATQGYIVQTAEEEQRAIGQRGRSVTMLRPAGRGRFGDKTYDIVSQGEFIEPDLPIEIVEAAGNRYVVIEVKETSS